MEARGLDLARRTVLVGSLRTEGALRGSVVLAEPDHGGHQLGKLPTVTLFQLFLWVFVCVFVAPVPISKI